MQLVIIILVAAIGYLFHSNQKLKLKNKIYYSNYQNCLLALGKEDKELIKFMES